MKGVVILFVLLVAAAAAHGQETKAPPAAAPQLSEDAKRAVAELQIKAAGLTAAQAVLQKELDAVNADFARLVHRLLAQCAAAPGYELTSTLTCGPKKEPPKKEAPGATPGGDSK